MFYSDDGRPWRSQLPCLSSMTARTWYCKRLILGHLVSSILFFQYSFIIMIILELLFDCVYPESPALSKQIFLRSSHSAVRSSILILHRAWVSLRISDHNGPLPTYSALHLKPIQVFLGCSLHSFALSKDGDSSMRSYTLYKLAPPFYVPLGVISVRHSPSLWSSTWRSLTVIQGQLEIFLRS